MCQILDGFWNRVHWFKIIPQPKVFEPERVLGKHLDSKTKGCPPKAVAENSGSSERKGNQNLKFRQFPCALGDFIKCEKSKFWSSASERLCVENLRLRTPHSCTFVAIRNFEVKKRHKTRKWEFCATWEFKTESEIGNGFSVDFWTRKQQNARQKQFLTTQTVQGKEQFRMWDFENFHVPLVSYESWEEQVLEFCKREIVRWKLETQNFKFMYICCH